MSILHCFWHIMRYWSKIADLNLLHLYLVPPLGVMPLEFRRDFWHKKTSPCAVVWHCLHDPRFGHFGSVLVCDWQTDGQTHDDSIYRASIVSHAKKVVHVFVNKERFVNWNFSFLYNLQLSVFEVTDIFFVVF